MAANPQAQSTMSEEAYLQLERHSETKHEYVQGQIRALAGASWRHNLICSNLQIYLGQALREKDCTVLSENMRVQVSAIKSYRYPDLVIVCGQAEFLDSKEDTLLNPMILVEVLSPSTALVDRNEKLREYRQLASLSDYLLVSQESARIERYTRHEGKDWLFNDYEGLNARLIFAALDCTLPLVEVYRKVDFADRNEEGI